jgi:hypothetical protein
MKIGFFRGRVSTPDGAESKLWWAQMGTEFWVSYEGSDEVRHGFEPRAVISVERITELELPDIGNEEVETIIVNILKGGYLEKPGVQGRGESLLFILVNEAIQKLSDIEENL